MIGIALTYGINLWFMVQNGWRRLWRRRVDYVRLTLSGTLPEFVDDLPWWQRLLAGTRQSDSLMGLRRQLQRIADDPQAQGVLLVVRDFAPGWATAESLRDEIRAFQKRGKRVVVYLHNTDTRSYFAICPADDILMSPTAYLYLLGIRIEARFLGDALRMLGLEAEVTAVSPYKAGGDQFARSNISPEHREQLERLLDQRYTSLVTAIAHDRRLLPERVRTLIDEAPYVARAARDQGLIDIACYEDEIETHLAACAAQNQRRGPEGRQKVTVLEWPAARRALRVPPRRHQRKYVAVVSIEGIITTGNSRTLPLPLPVIGGDIAGSESVTQALRRVERNQKIAALILHVDSPGGDAFASDLIWREVLRVRQHKPVVVSMGNVAASGGYYVAACANTIIAQPGTLTGSIGVYSIRPVASGLFQRIGVHTAVLSRGARTGLLAGAHPPTDGEREAIRQIVFQSYTEFKQRVCSGRGLREDQLEPIAGGRVWTGHEARQLGLVDDVGGLPAAIAKARVLAELSEDPAAPVLRVTARKRRQQLLPRPFPRSTVAEAHNLLEETSRLRILTVLPWELKE